MGDGQTDKQQTDRQTGRERQRDGELTMAMPRYVHRAVKIDDSLVINDGKF